MRVLTSLADLDKALQEPGPVILFKHSTRCPISAAADAEYRSFVRSNPDAATFTHLDLIAHRDVSNEIAKRLAVTHESPQAILVKAGKVVGVLNHDEIDEDGLKTLLGT